MTFCINPNGAAALLLGGVLYAAGDRLARCDMSAAARRCWRALALVSLLPGLLYALHYLHLFSDAAWYVELRSIAGVEALAGLAGFACGWAEYRGSATGRMRFIGKRPLLWLGLLFIMVPFLKPLLLPVDCIGNLHAMRRDGVVLQSVPGSCGPCATATILTQLGIDSSEEELARDMYSAFSGTEIWYLLRAVRGRGLTAGYRADAALAEVQPPAILGVTVPGQFGHFIAMLERTDTGMVIADSLRGRLTLDAATFRRDYEYRGTAVEIARAGGSR